MTPTEQDKVASKSELDVILAKHNGELGVTWEDPDVVTPDTKQALIDWHNKQVEEAMAKFHLKKGVKYDVKASDSVIVITHTNLLKGLEKV